MSDGLLGLVKSQLQIISFELRAHVKLLIHGEINMEFCGLLQLFMFLTTLQSGDTKYSLFTGSGFNISYVFDCGQYPWSVDHLGFVLNF